MIKKLGPVMVNTDPPYRHWDGNQATLLFFPVFFSFILVLISGLSDPLIAGLSIVDINTGVNGTVGFGSWGWCATGNPNVSDTCSPHRAFSASMQVPTDNLPPQVAALAEITNILPVSYLQAAGIFHISAIIASWLTLTWTLASSGAWQNEEPTAWKWTRWSFSGTFWSAFFITITWGLELGEVTRVQVNIMSVDGTQPIVTPGPAVWMMMVALLLNISAFITRLTWGKYKTRPDWTLNGQVLSFQPDAALKRNRGGGDFHRNARQPAPPLSAALPPSDDQPPTWESLSLVTGTGHSLDDKKDLERLSLETGHAV